MIQVQYNRDYEAAEGLPEVETPSIEADPREIAKQWTEVKSKEWLEAKLEEWLEAESLEAATKVVEG